MLRACWWDRGTALGQLGGWHVGVAAGGTGGGCGREVGGLSCRQVAVGRENW